jgi:ribosomal-protein-alanine N-acetyltransferase
MMFDFTTFPVLETERLILRGMTHDDARALLLIRGDPRVTRYNTVPVLRTLEDAHDMIERVHQAYEDQYRIDWGIVWREQPEVGLVGRIGFNYWLRDEARSSVGYDVSFAWWRRGIATEALRTVVGFGFSDMHLREVNADAFRQNRASCRVLEKVGFRYIGMESDYDTGVLRHRMHYTLTAGMWRRMHRV